MDTVRKPQFVDYLIEKGLSRADAGTAYDEMLDFIATNLAQGNTVQMTGFGKFTTVEKPAARRKVFKEVHDIPARTLVKFAAGRTLRDMVNDGA